MNALLAKPNEMISVAPYGDDLGQSTTRALLKSDEMDVVRIVLREGKEIPLHKSSGKIIVQCLEGRVEFSAMGTANELTAGKMLYLEAEVPHALRCLEPASMLVTHLKSGSCEILAD